jgi:hypothetical protein
MAGASFVFGSPADMAKIKKVYEEKALKKVTTLKAGDVGAPLVGVLTGLRARAAGVLGDVSKLEDAAKEWLATGEQGRSSSFIFWKVTGVAPECLDNRLDATYYPFDPDDFRRCRLLLEEVPSVAAEFRAVMGKDAGPIWEKLVAEWDTLCATMDEEAPNWHTKGGRAHKTYSLMKVIIDEATPSCGMQ